MPRNPAAKKNQHNNRHENGLVGPGKRVTKQKSNGHLNGNVKPPLPDEPVPTAHNFDPQPNSSSASCTNPGLANTEIAPTLTKRHSESSIDGNEQKWENVNGSASTSPRRNEMAQVKNKSAQDLNAYQMALTILRSCPAGDTVSLLIVLLALPSMVLTIVQALFASLTLMPPTNASPMSFLSLFDVFQGSAGSPSLGTMAVVDVICFGLWICLWTWAQNFALDLAQIQIAMTLGNGNSGKSGSVNLFCLAIVLCIHAIRSSGVRRFFMSRFLPTSLLSQPELSELTKFLPLESDFGDTSGPPSKISSLFAIHILSQAFMAFVRRRVASTQAVSSNKSARRSDADSVAGPSNPSEALDVDSAKGSATSVDYQTPSTPNFKDLKDKGVNAKKRRRQANQVRSRQPFWAALASTKVHVLREAEHNSANSSQGTDTPVPSLPQSQDTVWITNIDPSTIEFQVSLLSGTDRFQESGSSSEKRLIFIRINGARWHSVSIEFLETIGIRNQWCGTISGLAPDCTYTCSFNHDDEEEFAQIMVKTPALQDRDLPPSLAPAPPRASLRPHSPTTTLKNSISTAEAKLTEARARLTKTRRTHRAGVSRIEKEVDSHNVRLKSGGDDNRQRQKLLQAERNIQQTETTSDAITTALEELEAMPEEDFADYDTKKATFEEKSKMLSTANEALAAARAEAKSELSCVNQELNQTTSRKERLQARQSKLAEQQDRITQANLQGMNEKERKAYESASAQTDRQRRENELNDGIKHMVKELNEIQTLTQSHWREIESFEKQAYAQREMMINNSGPLTPEGNLPGTNPPQHRPFTFGHYPSQGLGPSENQASPFLAFAKTLPSDGRRPRSSTNRSLGAISNFSADAFEDADPIPPMPSNAHFEPNLLNGRKGSGSSRGKNNGSPAGVIGDNFRTPRKGSHSPGNIQGTSTW